MKRRQQFWPWWLALVSATVFALAIPTVRADKIIVEAPPAPVTTYHYEYYPEAEVYFVPETRLYWWEADGTWRSAAAPPSGLTLGARVGIDVGEREPWHHHEVIVKKYGGRHHKERIIEKDRDRD